MVDRRFLQVDHTHSCGSQEASRRRSATRNRACRRWSLRRERCSRGVAQAHQIGAIDWEGNKNTLRMKLRTIAEVVLGLHPGGDRRSGGRHKSRSV